MRSTLEKGKDDERPSVLEDELQSWMDLFQELADAAMEAGFTTIVTITGYDPISGDSRMGYGYTGDTYAALGATLTTVDLIKGT